MSSLPNPMSSLPNPMSSLPNPASSLPNPAGRLSRNMQSRFEKNRIYLTRLAGTAGVVALLITGSFWEAGNETLASSLFVFGLFLVAVASLGRMWCSLYIAGYKDKVLVTEGPYSLCRNPLYLFSLIGALGIGFSTETFTFPLIILALFAIHYPSVIRGEEARLKKLFGADYEEYAGCVPSFFPKWSMFKEPKLCIVDPRVFRRHLFSAVWFIWIIGILHVITGMRDVGWIRSLWYLY